jgi:hypothetical protein
MMLIYVTRILGNRYAEAYCVANSLDQASLRVYQAAARIVEASPLLAQDARVTGERITFLTTGGTITAIPSDYTSAAGANPTISAFDELWGYTSEHDHRLWDEMVPPPTRRIACRLTVSYAGYEGESELLEGLYKRGVAGRKLAPDLYAAGGLLLYWTHAFTAPWQTEEWREQMREQLRPNAYLRLIENRWVTTESSFVDLVGGMVALILTRRRSWAIARCRYGSGSTHRPSETARRLWRAPMTATSARCGWSGTRSSSRAPMIRLTLSRRLRIACAGSPGSSMSARSATIPTKWWRRRSVCSPKGCR